MTDRQPAIDLTRYDFKREMGDFRLYGTWIFNNDQEDYEPCLVVVPSKRSRSNYKPVCIALSACWQYNEPGYLARVIPVFLVALGMQDCLSQAHVLAELIHGHLRDLIVMRPNPTTTIVGADATITVDGKKHAIEVLDHKPLAQA